MPGKTVSHQQARIVLKSCPKRESYAPLLEALRCLFEILVMRRISRRVLSLRLQHLALSLLLRFHVFLLRLLLFLLRFLHSTSLRPGARSRMSKSRNHTGRHSKQQGESHFLHRSSGSLLLPRSYNKAARFPARESVSQLQTIECPCQRGLQGFLRDPR